jgi:hypothetical protein
MTDLSIDTKTLIHIATELVVVVGISFWLNRKINNLETILLERDQKILQLVDVLEKQSKLLMYHDSIFSKMGFGRPKSILQNDDSQNDDKNNGDPNPKEPLKPDKNNKVKPTKNAKALVSDERDRRARVEVPRAQKDDVESESEEIKPEMLDNLLSGEIAELSSTPSYSGETSKGTDLEFVGDKKNKKGLKKKMLRKETNVNQSTSRK